MPSSMIFAGLVTVWLLILVPTVARHRQEVARPSVAALSGRVLDRPRRPEVEVDQMAHMDDRTPVAARVATRTTSAPELDDQPVRVPAARSAADDEIEPYEELERADDPAEPDVEDAEWEASAPRFRPGRGGYDAEAAALAARARANFRQRVVLSLFLAAVVTALLALVALPALWWLHLALDVGLVGYLVYLRRQVRMEEAIRERRSARLAGARRRPEGHVARVHEHTEIDTEYDVETEAETGAEAESVEHTVDAVESDGGKDDLLREEPERVAGTGAPLPAIVTSLDELTVEAALPRLEPAPPPPLPAGTELVEAVDDEPELDDLEETVRPDYRRAVGE